MTSYDKFAKHYDAVMGDRKRTIELLSRLFRKHMPNAEYILELGCGTGTILRPFSKRYIAFGLDLSPEMLKIAKDKVKSGKFYHKNMTTFKISQKFDVIFCIFDSINHLTSFSQWEKVFSKSKQHLTDNGIFIFDINTKKKLQRLIKGPPWVHEFGKNVMIMDVKTIGNGITNWNVKVFEHIGKEKYRFYEEDVKEKSFPLTKIKKSLSKYFSKTIVIDPNNHKIKPSSERLYFICKK